MDKQECLRVAGRKGEETIPCLCQEGEEGYIRSLQAPFSKLLTQLDAYHTGIWVMEDFQNSLCDALIHCTT